MKISAFAMQLLATPLVFRALGIEAFPAYAATSAATGILGSFNLGLGGAMVTPLSNAAANGQQENEKRIFGTTLLMLSGLGLLAFGCTALMILVATPSTLLGAAATAVSRPDLIKALLFAAAGVSLGIPLSIADSARQAYQETHVVNVSQIVSNTLLLSFLAVAATVSPTLPAITATASLTPLLARIGNLVHLIYHRPHLLTALGHTSSSLMATQGRVGLAFVGSATGANLLLYQWPVYYLSRTLPGAESAPFALYIQLATSAISLGINAFQPLWPAVSAALAKGNYEWVLAITRSARITSLCYGVLCVLAFGICVKPFLLLWIGAQTLAISGLVPWVMGLYIALAVWEILHWMLLLGAGNITTASNAMTLRACGFAVAVPLLAGSGPLGITLLLTISLLAFTTWYYPLLLSSTLEQHKRSSTARHYV